VARRGGREEGDQPAGHGGVGGEVGADEAAVELRDVGPRGAGVEVGEEGMAGMACACCVGAEVEIAHGRTGELGFREDQRLVRAVSGWDLDAPMSNSQTNHGLMARSEGGCPEL